MKKTLMNFFLFGLFFLFLNSIVSISSYVYSTEGRFVNLLEIFTLLPYYFLLLIPLIFLEKFKKIYLCVIFFLLISTTALDVVLICLFGTKFSTGLIEICINTTSDEVLQYIVAMCHNSSFFFILFLIILLIIGTVFLIRFYFSKMDFEKKMTTMSLILLGFSFSLIYQYAFYLRFQHNVEAKFAKFDIVKNLAYPLSFTRIPYDFYSVCTGKNRLLEIVGNPNLPDTISSSEDEILGIVIIGESSSRKNYSQYGYSRNTTPELSKLQECVVFSDVITSATSTTVSLKNAFLYDNPEYNFTLSRLLSAAGFHSQYYFAQSLYCSMNTPLRLLFRDSEIVEPSNANSTFDDSVYNDLKNNIIRVKSGKKNLLFIHLNGQHFPYSKRYPKNWGSFKDAVVPSEYKNITPEMLENLNHYDNSVEYTDMLIGEIIKKFVKPDKKVFLLYFSDHADNPVSIMGQDRYSISGVPIAWEIPFIIYFSDAYSKAYPDIVKSAKNNKDKPYQTYELLWTIFDLCRISFKDFEYDKSLVSPLFKDVKNRKILDGKLDYQKK